MHKYSPACECELEICVDSLQSAITAIAASDSFAKSYQDGGAGRRSNAVARVSRLELCSTLFQDGLTPSAGLVITVCNYLHDREQRSLRECGVPPPAVSLFLMLRPHAGDFRYNEQEVAHLLADAQHFAELCTTVRGGSSIRGLIFGALNETGQAIDRITLRAVCEVAATRGLSVTFHRAIDDLIRHGGNVLEALDCIQSTAVDGFHNCSKREAEQTCSTDRPSVVILSSGGCNRAVDGAATLQQMVGWAADGPCRIMAGGGVAPDNLATLIQGSKVAMVHSSAKQLVDAETPTKTRWTVSSRVVELLLQALNAL